MTAVSIIYVGSIIYYTLVGPTVTGPVIINIIFQTQNFCKLRKWVVFWLVYFTLDKFTCSQSFYIFNPHIINDVSDLNKFLCVYTDKVIAMIL